MTFIDNDVSVAGDEIIDVVVVIETLNHCDIEAAVGLAFPAPDLTDLFCVYTKEDRQLRDPLLEERLTMDQDQSIAGALRDEIGPKDRLPDARRSSKHAGVVVQGGRRRVGIYSDECFP